MNLVRIAVAVVLLLACVVLIANLWRRRHTDEELAASGAADQLTAAVARHLRRIHWLAWPLAAGLATASLVALGNRAVLAAPVLLMLGVLVAYTVGEATAPVPSRTAIRSASLEPRDPAGYVTSRRRALWIGSTVVALAVAGSSLFLADETGRGLSVTCPAGGQGVGPFPGPVYGAPGLWALLAVQLMGFLAFGRITNRPATSVESAAPADRLLRIATTHVVVRATTAASLLLTAGVGLSAGLALLGLDEAPCSPGWRSPLGWASLALGIAAAAVLVGLAVDARLAARTSTVRLVAERSL